VDPIVNATILWSKCGREPGHCHYATVPPYDGIKRGGIEIELKRLSGLQPIQEVLMEMRKITVVFIGLGVVQPDFIQDPRSANQLTMTGLLEHVVRADILGREKAVGDLSYCLFDAEGRGRPEWEFFLTAGYGDPKLSGLAFFQKMADITSSKRVVAIAGARKRRVLMAALRAKLFNVWITDDRSAEWVLSQTGVIQG
jgi:DNA-binding transcriptional regulator LsrR (DeoR family)